ncbi:hypothetical protein BDZ97DRAFT_1863853, partial [Flammula alnicola]
SPICPRCNVEPETVTHFLKYCPAFKDQRRLLRKNMGPDTEIDVEILGAKQHQRALFAYLGDTKRFEESHGDLAPVEQPEEEEEIEEGAWG